MPKHPRPLIGLVVTGVALTAGAGAALLAPPRQTADIALPAPDATQELVVATYLDALNAHDCDTAEALMTEGAEHQARSWCEDVASLGDVGVLAHSRELPEWSGHAGTDEVVRVPVTFDLSWRPLHDDGSMDEGATSWGYLLMRDSEDSPWRIADQGVG